MHYLDNAATSWPKPEGVVEAVSYAMTEVGANPGRSGHRLSIAASRLVYATREALAALFHAPDPLRVVFTLNVTEALNLVLRGMLRPGDQVVVSGVEHNAVMRPLRELERDGVEVCEVPCSREGLLDLARLEEALSPQTALVVLNHASNVVGTIQPVAEVSALTRALGVPLLLDVAQTAGAIPIDMTALGVDLLAFTGHKSLLGPMGTGGLVISPDFDARRVAPLVRGGTGSRSEREEQPDFLPDRFESGTMNVPGIAGLGAALEWIAARGVMSIRAQEQSLTERLLAGLRQISGVILYGTGDASLQTATVSVNVDGRDPSDIGYRLDDEYGVLCRVGLHCSPAAHRTIGTYPFGTIRLSLGAMSTAEDVDATLMAVDSLAREGQ